MSEALGRLEEVLCRLSDLGLQLKAKKCTFMQKEVGRAGLECDPGKISAVRAWNALGSVKQVSGGCHGLGLITGAVRGNMGDSHLSGRSYRGFTVDPFGSGFHRCILARRDLDHCASVGADVGASRVAGVFGLISGVTVLAAAVRESVGRHGGKVVASPGFSAMSSQLAVPARERQDLIRRYHDSLFAGFGCFPNWCTGNGGLFSRRTETYPLPNKMALVIADACFQLIVCRFDMPTVIHSDQGREFENHLMQELCLLCGAHETRTTPYHPASDGLVERFNRTLLMMLAMFAGENRDDWDDLLPVVMMVYRSTGFSPYRLIFGEECTLPMDVGLPRRDQDLPGSA